VHLLALETPEVRVQGVYPRLTDTQMPANAIAGKYDGIMTPEEVGFFQRAAKDGITLEPPVWCAAAVARLAIGAEEGGDSGKVMYYDEHVPDMLKLKKARL